MIELSDSVTSDDLRSAIPLALQWRDWLKAQRGPDWVRVTEALTLLCTENKRNGVSYAQLAARTNDHIAGLLRDWLEYTRLRDEARTIQGATFDEVRWLIDNGQVAPERGKWCGALSDAHRSLEVFGFTAADIEMQLSAGIERIQQGEPPFERGYPVNRNRVIAVLRTWRNQIEHPWCSCMVPSALL
jgi:hypothetical protein